MESKNLVSGETWKEELSLLYLSLESEAQHKGRACVPRDQ